MMPVNVTDTERAYLRPAAVPSLAEAARAFQTNVSMGHEFAPDLFLIKVRVCTLPLVRLH
jgi:hypothetical protein